MRRIELQDDNVTIILTGLTMLEALQGRLVIPYANIRRVHPELHLPSNLVKLGGTTIGATPEGHFMGDDGWYFLSFEHQDRVITIELEDFYLGRQMYHAVAVEVDTPEETAAAIQNRIPSTARD